MKTILGLLVAIFTICCGSTFTKAQDVYVSIPESNIYNRTEFTSLPITVMTTSRTSWDYAFFGFFGIDPTFTSTSGSYFNHTTTSYTLPNSVLLWQLESMGGRPSSNISGGLPNFQSFRTSSTAWFEVPSFFYGGFNSGNINFTFKMPADQIGANAFYAGTYYMNISQNYSFNPRNFRAIITIPSSIKWLTSSLAKYIEISSINDYRSSGNRILDLGNSELGHTIDFNLWAKTSENNIQFTSSKGVKGTRSISSVKMGSAGSELNTKTLTSSFQNFSSAVFDVEAGNRNSFTPQLTVSSTDFKNLFFEAGTYTFQVNYSARSIDNTANILQNTDIQLRVLPLSEISIPSGGQNVNFNFNTAAQYANGQSQVVPKQIKLSNNESFELYVKSDENYFKKGGIQTNINSNILEIGVDGSSISAPLSKTPQKILSNGTPVLDRELNIKYTVSPSSAQSLVNKDNATYSINVIYSFTAL